MVLYTIFIASFMFLSMVGCNNDFSPSGNIFKILRADLEPTDSRYYRDVKEYNNIPYVNKGNVEFLRKIGLLKDVEAQIEKMGMAKYENYRDYNNNKRGIQSLAKNRDFPRRLTTQESPMKFVANYSYVSSYFYNNE